MRHAKSPAKQKKKVRRKRRAYLSRGRLELLRYTAPVGLIPSWADLALADPPESTITLLHLPYYHKAEVTSQTFALSRQNDVLHDAYQFRRAHWSEDRPKNVCPIPLADRPWS